MLCTKFLNGKSGFQKNKFIAVDAPLIYEYQVNAGKTAVRGLTTELLWQRREDNVEHSWEDVLSYFSATSAPSVNTPFCIHFVGESSR
jgi:hypothetical protein